MKILDINLCTKLTGYSDHERMAKVRHFIEDNRVDVVLFQEGLSICPPIYSTPWMLHSRGNLYHKPYIGFPWFYTFRCGVLSSYEIIDKDSAYLEVPQQEWLDSLWLPGRRRAVAVTINVPDHGIVALVSVHLSSSPKTEIDRAKQFSILIQLLQKYPGPLILAGDFNCNLHNPCMGYLPPLGLRLQEQSTPDFVYSRGLEKVESSIVLTDNVTDHAGGILVEFN